MKCAGFLVSALGGTVFYLSTTKIKTEKLSKEKVIFSNVSPHKKKRKSKE
jgi:hypothetical protein